MANERLRDSAKKVTSLPVFFLHSGRTGGHYFQVNVNTVFYVILFWLFPKPGGGINTIELHKIRYLLLWFHRYSKKRLSISTLYINCSLGTKGLAIFV